MIEHDWHFDPQDRGELCARCSLYRFTKEQGQQPTKYFWDVRAEVQGFYVDPGCLDLTDEQLAAYNVFVHDDDTDPLLARKLAVELVKD